MNTLMDDMFNDELHNMLINILNVIVLQDACRYAIAHTTYTQNEN